MFRGWQGVSQKQLAESKADAEEQALLARVELCRQLSVRAAELVLA